MTELRQTARRLLTSPGFTLTSVLTLALGLGATTAIFSVINGILIQPLPFPESERLVALTHSTPARGDDVMQASPSLYFTYREHNTSFESVALWATNTASVTDAGNPEELLALAATFEFLPTLGVRPMLGRSFTPAEDRPDSEGTVILSHAYWQRRFGGAESALGESLTIDGLPHTIIGVMAPDFRFTQEPAAILLPLRPSRDFALVGPIGERAIARLEEGVTLAEASADVERMIPIWIESFPLLPGLSPDALDGFGPALRTLKDEIVGDLDEVLWVLLGTIGMLLLIACANVANLELVRAEGRSHELAIRSALGARQGRLARSLLLESGLLGVAGGLVGVVLAASILPILITLAGDNLPEVLSIGIDRTVLVFAALVSFAATLVFGALPVLKHQGPGIAGFLSAATRSYSTTRERHRIRNALVVAQIALALVLLIASGLMIRTFESLRDVDPGFTQPERILSLRLSMPQGTVPDFARVLRLQNQIQDRLAAIPGVESAAFSSQLPLVAAGPDGPFSLEDRPGAAPVSLEFRYTSPGFFETLGTPFIAGRDFDWTDHHERRQVALVSEAFAAREWGSAAAALGKRLRRNENAPWLEIVGVVGDVHHNGLERPAEDTIYIGLGEGLAQFVARFPYYFVRSSRVGAAGFLSDVEQAIWSVDGGLPLGSVRPMGEVYAESMARTSLTLVLLGITAGMALALGLVGIYGVLSYMFVQRTRELGIRMALGARDAELKQMLLSRVFVLVGAGGAFGLGAAALLAGIMESLLFGVTAFDMPTYLSVSALVAAAALAAAYLPARRVSKLAPMEALRHE